MKSNFNEFLEYFGLAGAGWVIHLSTVESVAKIVSLLVPAFLSILVYYKNRKNKNE
ncbi:MAG: hypothetical protein HYU67_04640 [Flavobacteriia bacterium]|nr:hypothetical protein [Flavobacteriia bacterium]